MDNIAIYEGNKPLNYAKVYEIMCNLASLGIMLKTQNIVWEDTEEKGVFRKDYDEMIKVTLFKFNIMEGIMERLQIEKIGNVECIITVKFATKDGRELTSDDIKGFVSKKNSNIKKVAWFYDDHECSYSKMESIIAAFKILNIDISDHHFQIINESPDMLTLRRKLGCIVITKVRYLTIESVEEKLGRTAGDISFVVCITLTKFGKQLTYEDIIKLSQLKNLSNKFRLQNCGGMNKLNINNRRIR